MIIEPMQRWSNLHNENFEDQLYKYDWNLTMYDLVIASTEYDVYDMTEKGLKRNNPGNDNFWIIKRNSKVISENFIKYHGNIEEDIWNITINSKICKTKGGTKSYFVGQINRNGTPFYEIERCGQSLFEIELASIIPKLRKIPIHFNYRNWKYELINRKIWWREKYPATIIDYAQPKGCVTIISYEQEVKKHEVITDLFDPNINWFRGEE